MSFLKQGVLVVTVISKTGCFGNGVLVVSVLGMNAICKTGGGGAGVGAGVGGGGRGWG